MANLRADNLTGTGGRNAIDGSVYFQGYVDGVSSDYLKTADLDDYDMGTGDFTFECWLKSVSHAGTSTPNTMGVISSWSFAASVPGGILIQSRNTGPIRIVIPLSGGGYLDVVGTTNLLDTWNHIAVARSGSTLKAFVNGIEEISTTYAVGVDFALGGSCVIGENGPSSYLGDYPLRGYVSNLRLVKGTALYTTAFTPPTEKLTAVDGTVLLCCQDSMNPEQEATGKTLTGYGNLASVGVNENLVTNGNFTTGTTGWDDSLAPSETTLSSENQRLKIVASGGTGRARQEVTGLTIGNRYKFQVRHVTCASGSCFTHLGTSSGGAEYVANLGIGDEDLHTFYFTATATSAWIQIGITIGLTGYFDDVSLTLAESPKQSSNSLPPVGVDEGVTFGGDIKMNSQGVMYFPTGDTSQRGRGRGVFCGGRVTNDTQYINIQSGGNSVQFGEDTGAVETIEGFGLASATRAVFGGGQSLNAKMEYVTIATTGNTISFGNLTVGRRSGCGFSNQTRGIIAGGIASGPSASDVMDYITIASTGNATDFGDLTTATQEPAGFSSPTRGIIAGGNTAPTVVNTIEYITIATTGDATNFGDLTVAGSGAAGSSSQTRGLIMGGMRPANNVTIDYVTIASTGNATDFGDLTQARAYNGAVSNSIRGVSAGGNANPVSLNTNTIDYVDIATTGNANDFGDLYIATRVIHGASDSHGGLS